jgi:hypothetical protein
MPEICDHDIFVHFVNGIFGEWGKGEFFAWHLFLPFFLLDRVCRVCPLPYFSRFSRVSRA